ncbi:MAG TPA: dolichyl-phosphate-mannose--protein mannosyltransferase, partial [Candidatus Wallbacteria bacterium]|nr:dolichyl-phosphate-mannose--protein mannosyltransferase [Candidatus Wallbacteria bacterium]
MNKKILLIVFMAFMIRFVNAGAPIIGVQQWRQCDTAAIARNFYESGMDIFHPRIDWGGNSPGFVESEFQLYPFIVALLYKA